MSSNTTTLAVAKLTAPAPDDIFFYNNHISDNQLKTACVPTQKFCKTGASYSCSSVWHAPQY